MVSYLLIWWLVAQALGLAALPLTNLIFSALPDRGYAFSKPLGLLLTGYLAWLLAMLGLAPFGAPLLVICALGVLVLGLFSARRAHAPLVGLRPRWRRIVGYEALFLVALVFLATLRSQAYPGPDPWGTERPMDFALFNAIRRSSAFPPHDPWLAGYSINYYYFGYLLMAAMSLLSGIEPSAAYNLSLALIFALAAIGVAGIVANLIALSRPAVAEAVHQQGRAFWRLTVRGLSTVLAVVLVLLASNQGPALQVISGTPMVLALEGRDMARALINGIGPRQPLTLDAPFYGWDFDGTRVITPTNTWEQFNWWNPSRALWDTYPGEERPVRRYAITEFPFFSFWLGDMHPHVMALPFGLLALALVLQVLARRRPPPFTHGMIGWVELIVAAIVLGSLYVINSWDFPTYMLLFGMALVVTHMHQARMAGRRMALGALLGQAALVGALSMVLFAPFYLTFRSLVGAKDPLVDLPVLASFTRTIGVVTWDKTSLHAFLIIFGTFLLPLLVYFSIQNHRFRAAAVEPDLRTTGESAASARSDGQELLISASRALPWITLATLAAGLLMGFPLLALLPLGGHAVVLAFALSDRPAITFVMLAFGMGCLICLGTEVIYIRDVFESRMNTIFKFYYQVWLIWGTLAGYALWWLYERRFSLRRPAGYAFSLVFMTLLAGALIYPWLTAGRAIRDSETVGLVGRTPRQNTPAGAAAIEWLREHAAGDAVVLEAVGPSYDVAGMGYGGVSASTGLATVLGWPGHQQQWRGGDPQVLALLGPREEDVRTIYSTTDVARARELLDYYGVDYIYVGPTERATYPAEGLAKLPQLGTPVFEQDDVVIYQVERGE